MQRARPTREINYTAERTLRALEVVVFRQSTAPAVADAIGVHPRTARRILATLAKAGYLERRPRTSGRGHAYEPTVRLVAMAGQLAARLGLVECGQRIAEELHEGTSLDAYLVVPSYRHVFVIARAGEQAPPLWGLLPADEHAAGRLLLSYRDDWRRAFNRTAGTREVAEHEATATRRRGHALVCPRDGRATLAVAVPSDEPPLVAIALDGPGQELQVREEWAAAHAHGAATRLARGILLRAPAKG